MPAMARPDNASGVAAGDAVVYCVGVVDIEAGVAKAGVAVEADDEVNPVGKTLEVLATVAMSWFRSV